MLLKDKIESWGDKRTNRAIFFVSLFGGLAQILALLSFVLLEDGPLPSWLVTAIIIFSLVALTIIMVCLLPFPTPPIIQPHENCRDFTVNMRIISSINTVRKMFEKICLLQIHL